jgi:hypothetical protein
MKGALRKPRQLAQFRNKCCSRRKAQKVISARTVAAEVCRPVLSDAGELWACCEADYRTGFKEHVRRHLKKWFEEQAPRSMYAAIEEGLQRAWTQNPPAPLKRETALCIRPAHRQARWCRRGEVCATLS